jgi:hypothetical protein
MVSMRREGATKQDAPLTCEFATPRIIAHADEKSSVPWLPEFDE